MRPFSKSFYPKQFSTRENLNLGPSDLQSNALTTELPSPFYESETVLYAVFIFSKQFQVERFVIDKARPRAIKISHGH